MIGAVGALSISMPAEAQDIPGIENCTAEKQIERRTSCLQSNINYLKAALTGEVAKARADAQARADNAQKQITALQAVIAGLQDDIKKLRSDLDAAKAKSAQPSQPASPMPAGK